uniref:Uncharacterized protein n=1 Tax=Pipistrellus kuhlii TaxID=59472 RepID=A0A7J7X091_PIPKU|nr:hypothetical protein mPipKuh1_010770 [Pipistrellus kuhlii]
MEKQELPHAFNYNEEKCHSKIYIFLVRVLCPRPTPCQPSLSGHAAEPRNLTCRAPGLAKTGLVLSEQHQNVVTKRPAYFMSHHSLRRPRRTKQHPRPRHVDPSDLEPAARGRSWGKNQDYAVSGPGPHPRDKTGSHPFLTPATQNQQVPARRAEKLKRVQVLALSLELCDLWQVLRLLRLSCKMGILAINVKVLCT